MRRLLVISTASVLAGCTTLLGVEDFQTAGGDDVDGGPSDGRTLDGPPPPEVAARYVISAVDIPTNSAESQALGRDLDDDGSVDNQLGSIFAALLSANILVAFQAEAAIASGDAIWLHEVYAYELVDSTVAWWASYDGEPEASPDYSGNGVFAVDQTAPTTGRIDGAITDGAFLGERGTGRLVLGFGTGVVRVPLVDMEVAVSVTSDTCTGVIAGAIPDAEVDARVVPAMASAAQQVVADDPGCPATCGSVATDMLNLFDADADGTITLDEFESNSLITSLMQPDLDLDGDTFEDHLSVGVGVTCARASFATP